MNQAFAALGSFLLRHVVKQEFMRGYRMYFAGASSILGGVVVALDMFAGGEYSDERASMAFAAIVFGYNILGQAGKQDAIIATTAVSATAAVTQPPVTVGDVIAGAAVQKVADKETGHV